MKKRCVKPLAGSLLAGVVAVAIGACSSGSSPGGPASTGGKNGGTITIAAGTAPLSADQGLDFTTQGTELYSVVNTPLLTFKRGVQGVGGTQIVPGLAKSLPTVSNGGKTYTFFLRSGLHYSNGTPIKASDVTYALERDIKIPWQAASFVSAYIQGGTAYANGKAKTISGISTDDATGTITVNLVAPFAPIVDIFALAGTAPVPPSTPMKNLAGTGTIGDGPYKWGPITPGQAYTLVKNPKFDVPGLPRGHADKIVYNVNSNVLADAEQVLNNQADLFDPGDTLPASILQQVQSQAKDRYQPIPTNSTFYFWFGVTQKPFNNLYARQAVLAALDLRALSRLDSGFLAEDCHLIPPGIDGHSSPSTCPFHSPTGAPNMTMAKQLMQKSGMIGQPVTVYGEDRSPRRQWLDYYTSVLNSLGFKATEKVVNSSVYFTTIGAPSLKPQTGWGDWVQDFPNPWDFMQLFAGNAGSSLNYGYVNDPHYNSTLNTLYQSQPKSVASQWSALDQYAVGKAYYAAYGHEQFPKFYSNRLNFGAGVMSVEYQTDMTSLELK
ncbi:MAG TPA: ABC transporter substrate-binding protein [Streptosporangiaceae bacterium]|jgi:peptide/nickel transport system substrate-binding protein|nr:ABC transporter substrate-binding protein [Streptosporangiaceae bacterium]